MYKHKVNKPNTKISTHYRIIWLYSENVCYYFFIMQICFNFFKNMFYTKRIEINNTIIL